MLLKKHNVSHYKDKDVELRIDLGAPHSQTVHPVASQNENKNFYPEQPEPRGKEEPEMTEEDWLFYSSGYDPKSSVLQDPQAENN